MPSASPDMGIEQQMKQTNPCFHEVYVLGQLSSAMCTDMTGDTCYRKNKRA